MEAAGTQIILNEVNTADYPDVRLFTTVLRDGKPVPGLTAKDFRVREEEIDQEPLQVEPRLPPLSVIITLDASGSMSKRMTETQAAAKAFVTALDPQDSAQLVAFAREVRTLTPMSSSKTAVTAAIEQTVARGDTALYDALYQSIELLAERPGRKAVVLLSDGVDDDGTGRPLSQRTVSEAIQAAQRVNAPIYVIGLGTEIDEAVLKEIADATGALYLNAPQLSDLQAVYANIGAQLSGQYAIRYTSNLPPDGTPRRVALALVGTDGLTDSKLYTAPGSAAPVAPVAAVRPTAVAGECIDAAALETADADLKQIKKKYDANLIGATDRNVIRDRITQNLGEVLRRSTSDRDCIAKVLESLKGFYDVQLITVTQRNTLREILVDRAGALCLQATSAIEPASACLGYFKDLYQRDLMSVTQRNHHRDQVWNALLPILQQQNTSLDAAIELSEVVTALYNRDHITVTQRNEGRATPSKPKESQ
jgi:Ca-activated chloride channel family protein